MNNFSPEFFSKDYFFGGKNSNYLNYNQWDNDRHWRPMIKQIEKLKVGGKILDVGCAFGFFLKRLQPYFNELHGIDISDFAIQRAKKEVPSAQYRQINLNNQELPYFDEYFDLITAFDVLEHTNSIEKSLQKITKKLKKDGYLIISLPLKDTWAGKIFRSSDKDKSHVSVPKKKDLLNVVEKSGLKILEKNYFLNVMFFKLRRIPRSIELILQKR